MINIFFCIEPYFYELRAYIYQARNLLSMDNDSFSDPFAQIGFINQSQRTEIIQKTLCPTWDQVHFNQYFHFSCKTSLLFFSPHFQTLIFSNVELYGEPDEIHHDPPNILIEFFDKDQYVNIVHCFIRQIFSLEICSFCRVVQIFLVVCNVLQSFVWFRMKPNLQPN